jgi:hypothetical protein
VRYRVAQLVGEGWWARQDLPRLMGIADAGPGTTIEVIVNPKRRAVTV